VIKDRRRQELSSTILGIEKKERSSQDETNDVHVFQSLNTDKNDEETTLEMSLLTKNYNYTHECNISPLEF
jgi:hypothetical protein